MFKYLFAICCVSIFSMHEVMAQITPCENGFAGEFPCDNVDLLAHLSLAELGGGSAGNDIWGWTDTGSGREFVIMGKTTGTAFVEITDPVNPVYLGTLPTHTSNSSWRDMKTYKNYAFIVSEAGTHGIQVFDLTRLLNVNNPPTTFSEDAHHASLGGSAHNIVALETGYMILVGSGYGSCGRGFDIYNVTDPLNIRYESCYGAIPTTYTHDAVCFIYKGPDAEHVGKEICIGSNGNRGGTSRNVIVDVTDKQSIQTLSNPTYSQQRYAHQSWITDDHQYLIFNDELDELDFSFVTATRTHIMDIRNLDDPKYMGYYDHNITSIDHNCHVKGQYVYEANYESGLRVLDLTNVADTILSTVAYFDTYPNGNTFAFRGAWGNYPYFDSGVVAVSDINRGLFLLRPNLPHFIVEVNQDANEACPGEDLEFNISLKSFHGYDDDVNLTLEGLPSGASAFFGSTVLSDGESTTLTISNTAGLAGNYGMLVKASGSTTSRHHEKAIYIAVGQFPATEFLDDVTIASDQIIRATQSVELKNVTIDNNTIVTVISPLLTTTENLTIKGSGRLIWKQEDLCTPH